MPEIGAHEAESQLPELLERIRRGERFVITRHGQPVAELIPVGGQDRGTIQEAIRNLRALRSALEGRGVRLRDVLEKDETLRELAHAGHRY